MRDVRWFVVLRLVALPLLVASHFAWAAPLAYVANFDDDSVSVLDTATDSVVGQAIKLPNPQDDIALEPIDIAATPDGKHVYVANDNASVVSVVDTATRAGISVDIGVNSTGIATTPDGKYAYVAEHNPGVTVINTADNTVLGEIDPSMVTLPPDALGFAPFHIAMSRDGSRAYVTNFGGGVVVIDLATQSFLNQSIPTTGTGFASVAVSLDGKSLYDADDAYPPIEVIDTTTATAIKQIQAADFPKHGVTVTPDGKQAYVTGDDGVWVVATATNTLALPAPIVVGTNPVGIAVTPDGTKAYVCNSGDGTVSVINTATNQVVGTPIAVGHNPRAITIPAGQPAGAACIGDCDAGGTVTVNEIIVMVNMALGTTPCCATCAAADPHNTGQVIVTQIITAVNNALNGCSG